MFGWHFLAGSLVTVFSQSSIFLSQYFSVNSVCSKAPFSCKNFWLLATVAFSFLFGKNCPIMDYLGLKDSSRQLRANCVISYSFYLHLMFHACAARFDVTGNLENFWILGGM